MLNKMIKGNGLRDVYSATLERIKAQEGGMSRLGMEALMWLSHSKRPLSANELCHALGVELESIDPDPQNIPAIETLLGCSLGLVTLEASSHTLRLVHYTLHEYLSNNPNLFDNPHSMIAEVCLTYLNFQCIRDLSPIFLQPWRALALLEYASCYWGEHTRDDATETVSVLALRLLDRFDKHISSAILSPKICLETPAGFTGLHYAAYFGMVETAIGLLNMKKWDLEATDVQGNTAILWAARNGHGAIVQILLKLEGVRPNIADNGGQTPLSWAAKNRCEDVVKMLIEREDVTPNTADREGRTPLLWATQEGHEGVVKMLLERGDVNPDTADEDDITPLLWAVMLGDQSIVRIILDRKGATPNTADKDGTTPLLWAAKNGCQGIVEMLLEREDIAPNTVDRDGQTPLSWAVRMGYMGIVKTLLDLKDITPDSADRDGRTPLSWAAGNGSAGIVKMLLECKDVASDAPDEDGRTPLSWAAELGHEGVVGLLLKREDVTPDTVDKVGQTPLLYAARGVGEDAIRILLQWPDVASGAADICSMTCLSWPTLPEDLRVVDMLLRRCNVTPNTLIADLTWRTALWRTSSRVVKWRSGARRSLSQHAEMGGGRENRALFISG